MELGGINLDLEPFLAVHGNHGDPDPVLELQRVVPFDVDLLERERRPRALSQDHLARDVAEVASGPGIEADEHERDATAAPPVGPVPPETEARPGRIPAVHDIDDLELHRRLASGDRTAFDELYRRYGAPAFGLAFRVTGQQVLAQDVVHDAFMALWRAPEAFDPARGTFRTFFLSLVHHRAVDTVRREERLRKRQDKAANLEAVTVEDPAGGVVDAVDIEIRRGEVRAALDKLPPEQRQVLELAYFGGMTQVQIADRIQVPVGTVKTRTLAAMRKLRRMLEREDEV